MVMLGFDVKHVLVKLEVTRYDRSEVVAVDRSTSVLGLGMLMSCVFEYSRPNQGQEGSVVLYLTRLKKGDLCVLRQRYACESEYWRVSTVGQFINTQDYGLSKLRA